MSLHTNQKYRENWLKETMQHIQRRDDYEVFTRIHYAADEFYQLTNTAYTHDNSLDSVTKESIDILYNLIRDVITFAKKDNYQKVDDLANDSKVLIAERSYWELLRKNNSASYDNIDRIICAINAKLREQENKENQTTNYTEPSLEGSFYMFNRYMRRIENASTKEDFDKILSDIAINLNIANVCNHDVLEIVAYKRLLSAVLTASDKVLYPDLLKNPTIQQIKDSYNNIVSDGRFKDDIISELTWNLDGIIHSLPSLSEGLQDSTHSAAAHCRFMHMYNVELCLYGIICQWSDKWETILPSDVKEKLDTVLTYYKTNPIFPLVGNNLKLSEEVSKEEEPIEEPKETLKPTEPEETPTKTPPGFISTTFYITKPFYVKTVSDLNVILTCLYDDLRIALTDKDIKVFLASRSVFQSVTNTASSIFEYDITATDQWKLVNDTIEKAMKKKTFVEEVIEELNLCTKSIVGYICSITESPKEISSAAAQQLANAELCLKTLMCDIGIDQSDLPYYIIENINIIRQYYDNVLVLPYLPEHWAVSNIPRAELESENNTMDTKDTEATKILQEMSIKEEDKTKVVLALLDVVKTVITQ